MIMKRIVIVLILWGLVDPTWANDGKGLKKNFILGSPEVASVKALTMGPDNILFIGDNDGMKVIAIDLANEKSSAITGEIEINNLDQKLAEMFGTDRSSIQVEDLVVSRELGQVFFSVSVKSGDEKEYIVMTIDGNQKLREFSLENVRYSEIALKDAPNEDATLWRGKSRTYTITDMAYAEGELIVSGLSNEEFASSLRRIPFPFTDDFSTTGLQVYHVSHGKNETHAPVYRFLPYKLNNQMHIIAGYMWHTTRIICGTNFERWGQSSR